MESRWVYRGRKNWDEEVVRRALSSGLGEGFLARQWAGGGKPKREGLLFAAALKRQMFPGHCTKKKK